jgi:hypothetical protein
MELPEMTEHRLADMSEIQVRYFTLPSKQESYLNILVIRYQGEYPVGSAGNPDARYMYAMATAGIAAFRPFGVIHDLSELGYTWGDMLDMVLDVGPFDESKVQSAVVVGPRCEEAVRTLLLGETSTQPLEAIGSVFRDVSAAWGFVSDQIATMTTRLRHDRDRG